MKSATSWLILSVLAITAVAVDFSLKSIGYWREALADGFTGLTITRVAASTFLAVVVWAIVVDVGCGWHRDRRRRDAEDSPPNEYGADDQERTTRDCRDDGSVTGAAATGPAWRLTHSRIVWVLVVAGVIFVAGSRWHDAFTGGFTALSTTRVMVGTVLAAFFLAMFVAHRGWQKPEVSEQADGEPC